MKLRYLLANREIPRKFRIHVNASWAALDLTEHLREKLVGLQASWRGDMERIVAKMDVMSQ